VEKRRKTNNSLNKINYYFEEMKMTTEDILDELEKISFSNHIETENLINHLAGSIENYEKLLDFYVKSST